MDDQEKQSVKTRAQGDRPPVPSPATPVKPAAVNPPADIAALANTARQRLTRVNFRSQPRGLAASDARYVPPACYMCEADRKEAHGDKCMTEVMASRPHREGRYRRFRCKFCGWKWSKVEPV